MQSVVIGSGPTKFQFLGTSKCQSDHSGFNLNTEINWKSTHDGTHMEETCTCKEVPNVSPKNKAQAIELPDVTLSIKE